MYILSHASPDEVLAGKTTATTTTSGFAYAAFAVQGRCGPMSLNLDLTPYKSVFWHAWDQMTKIATDYTCALFEILGHWVMDSCAKALGAGTTVCN